MTYSAERRWAGIFVVCSLFVAALSHLSTLSNPFLYDDVHLIAENALLRSPQGLRTLLTHAVLTSNPVWQGHYRPLLMLSFWLNHLFGTEPFSYRLTNLIIHLSNGVLVFFVVRQVLRIHAARVAERAAAFACALFLLHPVQALVIELVLKRNTSLCTFFTLITVLIAARIPKVKRGRIGAVTMWTLALMSGAAALGCKEDGVAVPALVAVYLAALGIRRPILRAVPFVVCPLLFTLLLGHTKTLMTELPDAVGHLLAQPLAFGLYARMLVDPDAIAAGYDLTPLYTPLPWLRVVALAVLVFATLSLLAARRRLPLTSIAVAWAIFALAPSSSLVPLGVTVDEVRLYAALIFFWALAGVGLANWMIWIEVRFSALRVATWIGVTPVLLIALLLATATLKQNDRWANPTELWAHAVMRYPSSAVANRALCERLGRTDAQSALQAALPACRRAVALWPGDPFTRYALEAALVQRGQMEEAAAVATASLQQSPDSYIAWLGVGHLAWMQNQLEPARQAYQRALALDPLNDSARVHLADVLQLLGDRSAARELVHSFIDAPPGDPEERRRLDEVSRKLKQEGR